MFYRTSRSLLFKENFLQLNVSSSLQKDKFIPKLRTMIISALVIKKAYTEQ